MYATLESYSYLTELGFLYPYALRKKIIYNVVHSFIASDMLSFILKPQRVAATANISATC